MEPVPNRANDERRKNFMASVPTYTTPTYAGASRAYSPGADYDNAAQEWDAVKDSGATHYGKHSWYAVGGDEYGAPYDVCMSEGCTTERHFDSEAGKYQTYPGGKK
jgi:hypothetical protein